MLLVSLLAHAPEPCQFVVATDRPERYVWFGTRVEIEYLDAARLEAWRGPKPFSMRQKLELLRAAAISTAGAVVLLDADVLPRTPLDRFVPSLPPGDLFMPQHEYFLSPTPRTANPQL